MTLDQEAAAGFLLAALGDQAVAVVEGVVLRHRIGQHHAHAIEVEVEVGVGDGATLDGASLAVVLRVAVFVEFHPVE